MTDETSPALPEGEYAIVECLGHRTLVGRIAEVERFGTKMLAIEPLFAGALLPTVMVGGGSLYAVTPCTADVAARRQPTEDWQLPATLRATLPMPALAAPSSNETGQDDEDGEDPDFSPSFLVDRKIPF